MSDRMGPPQPLNSGTTYISSTDGFMVGDVTASDSSTGLSFAWIWGETASGLQASAAGGNVNGLNQTQSFMMPVAANVTFSPHVVYGASDVAPVVTFSYVPLGDGIARGTGDSIADDSPAPATT